MSAGDIAARKVFPNAKYLDFIASADAAYNVKIKKMMLSNLISQLDFIAEI